MPDPDKSGNEQDCKYIAEDIKFLSDLEKYGQNPKSGRVRIICLIEA